MVFSRSLFYQLRDLAVLSNQGAAQVRYSDAALELKYEYHSEHEEPIGFFSRWAPLATLAVLIPQLWPLPSLWMNVAGLLLVAGAILQLFKKSVIRLKLSGSAVLTYAAGDDCFLLQYDDDNALPDSKILSFINIQAVRIRTITNGGEDDHVYGVVEIQHLPEGTWVLLAELPTQAAARQLVDILVSLVSVTEKTPESALTL